VKKSLLIVVPLALAALYLLLQSFFPDGSARTHFYLIEISVVKLLALSGCIAAAERYRRGEYLNIAWGLLATHYGLLLAQELLFGTLAHLPGISDHTAQVVRTVCIFGANLAGSICAVMLARVWGMVGIALSDSKTSQRVALAAAMGLTVTIVGFGTWKDLWPLFTGAPGDPTAVASDLGDLIGFSMIAPILLTAIAMRGGTLAWPWGLITASYVCWLIYDMTWSFQSQLHLSEYTHLIVAEFWRCLACALAFSAGLAQRWAIRSNFHLVEESAEI
jgi:hypothetical protein